MKPPKRITTSAVLLACSWAALAGQPAGITAFACKDGQVLHLLAFDNGPARQAWGHFGGKSEPYETPQATATREFFEESNCFYNLAKSGSSLSAASKAPGSSFLTFSAKVPYVPAEDIAVTRDCVHVERSQWVWVTHSELQAALDSQDQSPVLATADGPVDSVRLWSESINALRQARKDGLLPDSAQCNV